LSSSVRLGIFAHRFARNEPMNANHQTLIGERLHRYHAQPPQRCGRDRARQHFSAGACVIAAVLSCATPARSDEPRPAAQETVTVDVTPTGLAQAWAADRFSLVPGTVLAKVLDSHTGLDAIAVYDPTAGRYLPVVVIGGEVLDGAAGFVSFLRADGRTDALRVAGAWTHLHAGLQSEVLGDWRIHRKAATWPSPRWEGDELVFLVQDGGEKELRVTLAADGTPTVVNKRDGSGLFLSPRRGSSNR
jgi:hypothetical protein